MPVHLDQNMGTRPHHQCSFCIAKIHVVIELKLLLIWIILRQFSWRPSEFYTTDWPDRINSRNCNIFMVFSEDLILQKNLLTALSSSHSLI